MWYDYRKRGRPKKWMVVIVEDMKTYGVNKDTVTDRKGKYELFDFSIFIWKIIFKLNYV